MDVLVMADRYNSVVEPVTEAIDESIKYGTIVGIEAGASFDAVKDALSEACDDTVDTGEVVEFWGSSEYEDEPRDWRVHLYRVGV